MEIKKIFVLAVIAVAALCLIGIAAAGTSDASAGSQDNVKYTFDGFTLLLPGNGKFSNNTIDYDGAKANVYTYTYSPDGKNTSYITINVLTGKNIVKSADAYKKNWIAKGAKDGGKYKEWSIVDANGVPLNSQNSKSNAVMSGYELINHRGSKIITIDGNDLDVLKKIADSYKET